MACGEAIDVTMSSRGQIGGEPFEYVLYAEPDEPRLQSLRAAMTLAVDVLQANGPWLRLARAYVMTDAAGDCLYVPPAWLLDLDEHDRGTARRWRLMRGTLTEPASGHEFEHAGIEGHGLVVIVRKFDLSIAGIAALLVGAELAGGGSPARAQSGPRAMAARTWVFARARACLSGSGGGLD